VPVADEVIVGVVTVTVVPELVAQIALSFSLVTLIDGLVSVFVPLLYTSAAVEYALLVESCRPQDDDVVVVELTVKLSALEVLLA
jgi:hypothetical protein